MSTCKFYAAHYAGPDLHPFAQWRHFGAVDDDDAMGFATELAPPNAIGYTLYSKPTPTAGVEGPSIVTIWWNEEDA